MLGVISKNVKSSAGQRKCVVRERFESSVLTPPARANTLAYHADADGNVNIELNSEYVECYTGENDVGVKDLETCSSNNYGDINCVTGVVVTEESGKDSNNINVDDFDSDAIKEHFQTLDINVTPVWSFHKGKHVLEQTSSKVSNHAADNLISSITFDFNADDISAPSFGLVSSEPIADENTRDQTYDDTDIQIKADVIAMMKNVLLQGSSVQFDRESLTEADEELLELADCGREADDRLTALSIDTYNAIPRGDWGFTSKTFPELNFSWNSEISDPGGTGSLLMSSRITNQYLHSNASIYYDTDEYQRLKDRRKRRVVGVRWNPSVEALNENKKLFSYDVTTQKRANELIMDRIPSRNASRLALESREAMFRRAMSLLSARCASVRQAGAAGGSDDEKLLIGGQPPKYFYVTQDKPVPMEPLKAWRGYHGNIYFEPINIHPLKVDTEDLRAKTSIPRTKTSIPRTSETLTLSTSSIKRQRLPLTFPEKEGRPLESRSESRQTNKSSLGSRRSSQRPVVFLDKQSVLTRFNDSLKEDLVWLEGQENTGSLAVRPKSYPDPNAKERERDLQYNRERIKKGSVAHKLYVEHKSKQKPKLSVSGGKFNPPNSLSPLLRTQTQYSLSSNRLTTNSPDPYHLNEAKLPPLHADGHREGIQARPKLPYNRSVTLTDDMKPFVKYSHDVKVKMAHQAGIC